MKQPTLHDKAPHGCWADRWNHYRARDTFTPDLDAGVFRQLLGSDCPCDYIDPELFMHGCLDAPDEIPCGSTRSILTIGGFHREEYNRQRRGTTDWRAAARASDALAIELKKILAEVDAPQQPQAWTPAAAPRRPRP